MIYITVPDRNDSLSRAVLAGKEYNIRFLYNMSGDYWSFGLYDVNRAPIAGMIRIVPRSPLTFFYRSVDMPDGLLGVVSDLAHIGRNDFKNGNARFCFIPAAEMEGWYNG